MPHSSDAPRSSLGAETGLGGRVTLGRFANGDGIALARLKKWSIAPFAIAVNWGSSSSMGFDFNIAGRRGCRGTIEAVYDKNELFTGSGHDFLREGNVFAMQLWLGDPFYEESSRPYEPHADQIAGDVARNLENYFDFPQILITNGPRFSVDAETEKVMSYSFDFVNVGPFFHPGHEQVTPRNFSLTQPLVTKYPPARDFSEVA